MNELQKQVARSIVNIFETGRIHGDYGAVAVLKGDSGHLTYGRSQTTLGSGNLFLLVKAYCGRSDARLAAELRPFLPALAARDLRLDGNLELREHLREAGRHDPAMQAEQDRFFDANYFDPALRLAQGRGICTALGQTVVYDSYVQGGFARVTPRVGAPLGAGGLEETAWIAKYIAARKQWLLGLKPPLPDTVYRMNCFAKLVDEGAWELPLPLTVRGHLISEETLGDQAAVVRASAVDPADQPPLPLYLTTPYQRGSEVRAVQEALEAHGFPNAADGVYGPYTEALVRKFQESKGLQADGVVGPGTRQALGL